MTSLLGNRGKQINDKNFSFSPNFKKMLNLIKTFLMLNREIAELYQD